MRPFAGSKRWWIVVGIVCLATASAAAWPYFELEFRIHQARTALRARRGDEALAWLSPLTGTDPKSGEFHFLLARAYRRVGRLGQIEACLIRARELGHPAGVLRREQILTLAQSGHMTEVDATLSGLLLDPGDDGAEICEAFAAGYFLNYRISDGLKILKAWELDYPRDAQPHVFRGKYYEHIEAWQGASSEYRVALKLSPDATGIRTRLAQMLVELNEHAAALKEFNQCLEAEPNHVAALIGRARCLTVAGHEDAARRDLQQALDKEPGSAEALGALGQLDLEAGDRPTAIRRLRQAVDRDPNNIEIRYALAGALQAAGDAGAARDHFKYVDDARAAELKIHADMQFLLKHEGDLERDEEIRLRLEIGSLTLRYGAPADGVSWLQSVLERDPGNEDSHQLLFEYYSKQGDEGLADRHRKAIRSESQQHGS